MCCPEVNFYLWFAYAACINDDHSAVFVVVTCAKQSRRVRTNIVMGKEELRRGLGVLEKRWENLERCLADFGWHDWGEIG